MFEENAILLDTCFGQVRAAYFERGKMAAQACLDSPALEGVFETLHELKAKTGFDFSEIKTFAFCNGVGGVLGVRAASAALSTLALLEDGARLFTWGALDAAFIKARELCAGKDFCAFAPSRKGFANCVWNDGAQMCQDELSNETFLKLFSDGRRGMFFIPQRGMEDERLNFLQNWEPLEVCLEDVARFIKDGALALNEAQTPPEALLLSKREYVKWNSQART